VTSGGDLVVLAGRPSRGRGRHTRATRSAAEGHLPGLDGLRGVAVAVVLLFHAKFSWIVGGYLGVSLFFTLSGFLITGIVLRGLERGEVDLRGFWARRARRLLPAAMLCVAVVVLAAQFGAFDAHATAVDGIWALLYAANWRFILSGQSYANLFAAPSPLLHYWSLAIEEQYYLLFPLAAWLCCRTRRPRVALTGFLLVILGISIHAHLSGWSVNRMYYGTDVRAGEIAIGALLAVAMTTDRLRRHPQWLRWMACAAQVPALVVAAWAILTVPQSAGWLYHGGLLGLAVCWAVLILGVLLDVGPVRLLARMRALVRLGTISYGVYLIHWPLFLLIHPSRNLYVDAGLAISVTMVVAVLSYRLLERPIRYGTLTRPTALTLAGAGSAIITGTAAVALLGAGTAPAFAQVPTFTRAAAPTESTAPPAVTRVTPAPGSSRDLSGTTLRPVGLLAPGSSPPLRVLVIGDSTGSVIGHAMEAYAATINTPAAPRLIMDTQAEDGCSLADTTEQSMTEPDEWVDEGSGCRNWAGRMAVQITIFHPNVVLMIFGPTQTADVVLPGSRVRSSILDPSMAAATESQRDALEALVPGAWWVWATDPRTFTSTDAIPQGDWVVNRADRTDAWNTLVARFGAAPHNAVLDLSGWVLGRPEGPDSTAVRPDGMHVRGPPLAQLAVWTVDCLESIPAAGQLQGGQS
jgi:peptidoglycan/LPS O-acetylase OafA/YrhL